jgi:hypothetical protein
MFNPSTVPARNVFNTSEYLSINTHSMELSRNSRFVSSVTHEENPEPISMSFRGLKWRSMQWSMMASL